jgi:hypothetical protein
MAGVCFGPAERFPSNWDFVARRKGVAVTGVWLFTAHKAGRGFAVSTANTSTKASPCLQGRGGSRSHHNMRRHTVSRKVRIQIEYCAE